MELPNSSLNHILFLSCATNVALTMANKREILVCFCLATSYELTVVKVEFVQIVSFNDVIQTKLHLTRIIGDLIAERYCWF